LRDVVDTVNVVQLDAINVLQRTQFVVPFSRIGPFDVDQLHEMSEPGGSPYETWGHAASLVPMEHEPLFRWRQAVGGLYDESPAHAERFAGVPSRTRRLHRGSARRGRRAGPVAGIPTR
jgi:uncharacterized protein YcaQ